MLKVLIGDIFQSRAQTLVNTVNCVGVMGKGVALQFKQRFPQMFEDYVRRCKAGKVRLGEPYLYRSLIPPWVINFPTKDHWRSVTRLEDVVTGLDYLEKHYESWGILSLAVPPLGCGEGQLEWRVVGPVLFSHLGRLSIPVHLYAPFQTPNDELEPPFLGVLSASQSSPTSIQPAPYRIQPAVMALVEILARLQEQPYHRSIGRVIFQKMAYFATVAGIPTGFQFRRGSYGPFDPSLKHVITQLTNNALISESRLGRMFAVDAGPAFEGARRNYACELKKWDSEIERVVDLFMRMDTDQAELAATVHFVATELRDGKQAKPTENEVLMEVMEWKRKRSSPFSIDEVALAIRNLIMLGWLDVLLSPGLPLSEEAFLGV